MLRIENYEKHWYSEEFKNKMKIKIRKMIKFLLSTISVSYAKIRKWNKACWLRKNPPLNCSLSDFGNQVNSAKEPAKYWLFGFPLESS